MYVQLVSLLALASLVVGNDVIVGSSSHGKEIFNETKSASPAIWKQADNVTIKANDTDVVTRIVITDLRPEKNGEAKIVEGGKGQKNVTIELKSPTVLRGYEFHIEVYAVPETEYQHDTSEEPENGTNELPSKNVPVSISKDTKINTGDDGSSNVDAVTDVSKTDGDQINTSTLEGQENDQSRLYRDTKVQDSTTQKSVVNKDQPQSLPTDIGKTLDTASMSTSTTVASEVQKITLADLQRNNNAKHNDDFNIAVTPENRLVRDTKKDGLATPSIHYSHGRYPLFAPVNISKNNNQEPASAHGDTSSVTPQLYTTAPSTIQHRGIVDEEKENSESTTKTNEQHPSGLNVYSVNEHKTISSTLLPHLNNDESKFMTVFAHDQEIQGSTSKATPESYPTSETFENASVKSLKPQHKRDIESDDEKKLKTYNENGEDDDDLYTPFEDETEVDVKKSDSKLMAPMPYLVHAH